MKTAPLPNAIDPLRVADRIATARYGDDDTLALEIEKEPRLVEALYFLAWVSNPENFPGGLRRFTADLIADSHDLAGPLDMGPLNDPKSGHEARAEWIENLPRAVQAALGVDDSYIKSWGASALLDDATIAERRAGERARAAREAAEQRAAAEKRTRALRTLTPAAVRDACAAVAAEALPTFLAGLCERKGVSALRCDGTWRYCRDDSSAPPEFPRIAEALFRFIDRWRERRQTEIAETVITREIFKWLGKCAATKFPVRIEGHSRYGKTEAVRTWCAMQPGRARLVDTPSAGAEGDLLRAVARALG